MKRIFINFLLLLAFTLCASAGNNQKSFRVGDKRTNLSLGVGAYSPKADSKPIFDQHFTMEWGMAEIGDLITLGVGFSINNGVHNYGVLPVVGTYDYYYTMRYRIRTSYSDTGNRTEEVHREGIGFADANVHRDDVNAQCIVSFHYSPLNKLDVYGIAGLGIGFMNFSVTGIRNERDFSERTEDYESGTASGSGRYTYRRYSYNDLDHVKWINYKTKVVPALSLYVGATYYLSAHWGIDLQIGLTSANIKVKQDGYPSSFGIFGGGISYKF